MIYYFSATGNSKHVASRLAQDLNEGMISVLDIKQPVRVGAGEKFILVYPNYCGGVPTMIRELLEKGSFQIDKAAELILVITYGNNTGASQAIATKYFKKNTKHTFDACYSVKMPDNWTPVFDLSNAEEVAEINRKADAEIDGIIEKIKAGSKGDFVKDKLGKMMMLIHPVMYKNLSKTNHFVVEDTCIGCGLCEQKCPVGAIKLVEGKPTWIKENCAMCLGCLHRCPKFAIQYEDEKMKASTRGHGQYIHPNEKM